MAVTSITATQIGPASFILTYASDLVSPTFYIWAGGRFVVQTPLTSYQIDLEPGEQLQVDVFDDATETPGEVYPGRFFLNWYAVDSAVEYRIEEYVDAAWTLRQVVAASVGTYYTWSSRFLEDDTTHRFRVIPVGEDGIHGFGTEFQGLMVRHPDAPRVTMAYDADTATVTVTAV